MSPFQFRLLWVCLVCPASQTLPEGESPTAIEVVLKWKKIIRDAIICLSRPLSLHPAAPHAPGLLELPFNYTVQS